MSDATEMVWKRGTVNINWRSWYPRRRQVGALLPVPACGLVVSRLFTYDGPHARLWVVTHIHSGLKLTPPISQRAAKAMLVDLVKCGNWRRSKKAIYSDRRMSAKARAILGI